MEECKCENGDKHEIAAEIFLFFSLIFAWKCVYAVAAAAANAVGPAAAPVAVAVTDTAATAATVVPAAATAAAGHAEVPI